MSFQFFLHYFCCLIFTICTISSAHSKEQNWKQVFAQDGITVFAKHGKYRIIPFKAQATLNYQASEILAVLKNWREKHLWSPKLKTVKVHKELASNEFIFSEYYKTPWPATDREFLLKGKIQHSNKNKIILTASSFWDQKLMDLDHIQADVKILEFTIEEIAPKQSRVSFEFHGDMQGWMPAWLINIIQKKWPFRFIEALNQRCQTLNASPGEV